MLSNDTPAEFQDAFSHLSSENRDGGFSAGDFVDESYQDAYPIENILNIVIPVTICLMFAVFGMMVSLKVWQRRHHICITDDDDDLDLISSDDDCDDSSIDRFDKSKIVSQYSTTPSVDRPQHLYTTLNESPTSTPRSGFNVLQDARISKLVHSPSESTGTNESKV